MKLFSKTSLARLIMLVAIGALLVGCNPDRRTAREKARALLPPSFRRLNGSQGKSPPGETLGSSRKAIQSQSPWKPITPMR